MNKFCSHEKFGNTAKDLVAKWKKNAAKCAAQNGIEYTEVPAEVSSKNSRKVQNNEPKKVKYETYKTSDHRVSSSEYDPADSGYERKRHNNNNNDNNTKKQKTDDKHKKKKHIDKKNDTFTPNCGSFEDILGACDKKVSKPKCAPINDSNLKPNQTDDVERRNSFDDVNQLTIFKNMICSQVNSFFRLIGVKYCQKLLPTTGLNICLILWNTVVLALKDEVCIQNFFSLLHILFK